MINSNETLSLVVSNVKKEGNDFTYNQEDQRLHFITGYPENDLPNIIKLLSKSGAHIQRIETNKASLVDVFLNLTGKGINQ